MSQALSFLAADLGAESGRVMVGRFDGGRLSLSEAHRFDSRPVRLPDGLHTDVLRIFTEIQHGLAAAAAQPAARSPASASTPGASTSRCSTRTGSSSATPTTTGTPSGAR